MDVQMPELDGYSATRIIRSGKLYEYPTESKEASLWKDPRKPTPPQQSKAKTEPHPSADWLSAVPIVAMTASAIRGDREKCRDAGMDDYLAKPVRSTTLEKMLLKWCPGKHTLRSNSALISAPPTPPPSTPYDPKADKDIAIPAAKRSAFTMAAVAYAAGADGAAGWAGVAVTERGIIQNPEIKRMVVEPPSLPTVVSVNSTPKASDHQGRPFEDPFEKMFAAEEDEKGGDKLPVSQNNSTKEGVNGKAQARAEESMPRITHSASAPM